MARKLARTGEAGSEAVPDQSTDERGELLLDRRRYVALGATAAAALVAGSAGNTAASDDGEAGETYFTDFSGVEL